MTLLPVAPCTGSLIADSSKELSRAARLAVWILSARPGGPSLGSTSRPRVGPLRTRPSPVTVLPPATWQAADVPSAREEPLTQDTYYVRLRLVAWILSWN